MLAKNIIQGQLSSRGCNDGTKQPLSNNKVNNQNANVDSSHDIALNQTYNFHKGHAANLLIGKLIPLSRQQKSIENTSSSSILKQAFIQGAQAAAVAAATGRA